MQEAFKIAQNAQVGEHLWTVNEEKKQNALWNGLQKELQHQPELGTLFSQLSALPRSVLRIPPCMAQQPSHCETCAPWDGSEVQFGGLQLAQCQCGDAEPSQTDEFGGKTSWGTGNQHPGMHSPGAGCGDILVGTSQSMQLHRV